MPFKIQQNKLKFVKIRKKILVKMTAYNEVFKYSNQKPMKKRLLRINCLNFI